VTDENTELQSDHEPTPGAAGTPDHDDATHMDAHASISDDDHGHGESLGPIDWAAWGYALVGVVAGLVVVFGFWIALN
jgi:hypothetical protein